MSSHPSSWKELSCRADFICPKLFYKFSSSEHGYKLLFTDLVGLWSDDSGSHRIHQYASDNHTSIDPSQSKRQFEVLLQKLEQSLQNGSNKIFQNTKSKDESVIIHTALDLPKPLKPLKWRFHLKPEASSEMAEFILRPSLLEASQSRSRLQSMLEIIDQKDHVISKLLEKVDNSAIDLSLIFPRISRLKSKNGIVTSKEAKTQVPGLAKFDYGVWNNSMNSLCGSSDFHNQGLGTLMAGCNRCPEHKTDQHEKWLINLPKELPKDILRGSSESRSQSNSLASTSEGQQTDISDGDSNDFETRSRKRSYQDISPTRSTSHSPENYGDNEAKRTKLERSPSATGNKESSVTAAGSSLGARRNSSVSTASDDSEDLDLPPMQPDNNRTTRLGQLDKKAETSTARKLDHATPSSDSMMPSPILSSSPSRPKAPLTSSSPPPQVPEITSRQASNAEKRGSSPSVGPSTPSKLGRLRSQQVSSPTTPSSKHNARDASLPITPTRRLGRVGASRAGSQAVSQSQHLEDNETRDDAASDSDASTSSTPSESQETTAPPLLPQESSKEFSTQIHGLNKSEVETLPELTTEEKAKRRRQELKKIAANEPGRGGGTAGAVQPVRKTRKF